MLTALRASFDIITRNQVLLPSRRQSVVVWILLEVIAADTRNEALTQKHLVASMMTMVSESTVSRVVHDMMDWGLVEAARNERHARSVLLIPGRMVKCLQGLPEF